jgi:hypothetical protein
VYFVQQVGVRDEIREALKVRLLLWKNNEDLAQEGLQGIVILHSVGRMFMLGFSSANLSDFPPYKHML